jgi:3-dehydroquinate dehydratase type I
MTKIVIPIRPIILSEGLSLYNKVVLHGADYTELWCDKLKLEDAKELVRRKQTPLVVNLKDAREGGNFSGTFNQKLNYLSELAQRGADYIDIPFTQDLVEKELETLSGKVILSYHDFKSTPSLPDLEHLQEQMMALNPAIIKIATQVNREIDIINLIKLQLNSPLTRNKRIIIGMGEKGKVTRAMSPMFENTMTFACFDQKSKTAPGQLTIDELRDEWARLNLNGWWANK